MASLYVTPEGRLPPQGRRLYARIVMPKTSQPKRQSRTKKAEARRPLTKRAMALEAPTFATSVVAWYRQHGRQDLPWQHSNDPYHRWVSEIMLQQTQVATVIPYYCRFIDRFPDMQSLATAQVDDVLDHWTGLGYYARARNLHRAAQVILRDHDGVFPGTFEEVPRFLVSDVQQQERFSLFRFTSRIRFSTATCAECWPVTMPLMGGREGRCCATFVGRR